MRLIDKIILKRKSFCRISANSDVKRLHLPAEINTIEHTTIILIPKETDKEIHSMTEDSILRLEDPQRRIKSATEIRPIVAQEVIAEQDAEIVALRDVWRRREQEDRRDCRDRRVKKVNKVFLV